MGTAYLGSCSSVITSTLTCCSASHGFNFGSGKNLKKINNSPWLRGRSSLNWVAGKEFWNRDGRQSDIEHDTHQLPIHLQKYGCQHRMPNEVNFITKTVCNITGCIRNIFFVSFIAYQHVYSVYYQLVTHVTVSCMLRGGERWCGDPSYQHDIHIRKWHLPIKYLER